MGLNLSFIFRHNACLWHVITTQASVNRYRVTGQSQIYLKSVLWLVTRTPLFDGVNCSYLAQLKIMVCRLQRTLKINAMILESKINVKYT